MLLTKEEIKQQTRQLWKTTFQDSEEFMDIYFEDKYTDDNNRVLMSGGKVAAAMQLLPYRMTFYGSVLHAGYVSGLCVQPECRGKGMASQLIREAHRDLYRQGGAISFLIPGNDRLRSFYEKPGHGSFWTATYRKEVELTDSGAEDFHVEVGQPDEWPSELYVFYRRNTALEFMFHPSENDFFAALAACDLQGGYVLVARRKRRVVGLCLAVPESDGKVIVRSILVAGQAVKDLFVRHLKALTGAEHIYARVPSPGAITGAVPYVMARVVNVERFLTAVLRAYPDFQLHIGVDGDLDVPENNGYYLMENGRLSITDSRPDSIVTPGGLAAMFLGAQPTYAEMLLDE